MTLPAGKEAVWAMARLYAGAIARSKRFFINLLKPTIRLLIRTALHKVRRRRAMSVRNSKPTSNVAGLSAVSCACSVSVAIANIWLPSVVNVAASVPAVAHGA